MSGVRRHAFKSIHNQDIAEWNIYAILNVFQMVVGIILLPVRLTLLIVPNVIGWVFTKLLTFDIKFPINYCSVQLEPSMPLWRRKIMFFIMYWFYRMSLWGFGVWWVEIKDLNTKKAQKEKKVASIVVNGPHQSLIDGINICCLDKPSGFTGVGALPELNRPFTGTFFQALEYAWVDYEVPESRTTCAKAILHRATNPAWEDVQQIFAVEGTTHSGNCFAQFKKGAFLAGQPVQPVAMEMPEWIDVLRGNLTKGRKKRRGAGWAGWCYDTPMWLIFLYQLTVFWQPVIIYKLPIYYPSEEEKKDAILYANNVRAAMAKATGFEVQNMNQHDGWQVDYMTVNFPKLNPTKFALYGQLLEEKYGSRALNKKYVRACFDEFIGLSKGKCQISVEGEILNFHGFVDSKLEKVNVKK